MLLSSQTRLGLRMTGKEIYVKKTSSCTHNKSLDTQHFLLSALCAISTLCRWWKRKTWCYSAIIYARIHWSNSLAASGKEGGPVTIPALLSSSRTRRRWGWWTRSVVVPSEETAGRQKGVPLTAKKTSLLWQRGLNRNHIKLLTYFLVSLYPSLPVYHATIQILLIWHAWQWASNRNNFATTLSLSPWTRLHICDRIWENPSYGIFFRKLSLMNGW